MEWARREGQLQCLVIWPLFPDPEEPKQMKQHGAGDEEGESESESLLFMLRLDNMFNMQMSE
jgi:hypothetical protein